MMQMGAKMSEGKEAKKKCTLSVSRAKHVEDVGEKKEGKHLLGMGFPGWENGKETDPVGTKYRK